MKILLLTSSLGAGGAERVATTLCNAWAARGDQVTLVPTFSGGGQPFYAVSKDVALRYLADLVGTTSKSPLGYLRRLLALRTLIAREKYDVVISFLPNVNVAAILSTFFLRVPVICCERRDPLSQPCSKIWEFACRLTYRFADMLTVQTESAVGSVTRMYPHLKQVRVVPNPLPEGVVATSRNIIARDRKVLVSLGRLSSEKQIELILSCFACIAHSYQDWDLHIYGDGPRRTVLDGQIQSLGMQGRVILKGRTSDPWLVMANADAFVMASKYEGFPNALLEAMGVGLPCVVFDCPSGPREICRDGKDALLVKLNDQIKLEKALRKIMSDESFRAELGAQAKISIMERYSLPVVTAAWDQIFLDVGATN